MASLLEAQKNFPKWPKQESTSPLHINPPTVTLCDGPMRITAGETYLHGSCVRVCDEVCHHVLIGIVSKKKCLPGSHVYILVHKSPRQVFLYYTFLLILAKYSDQAGCQHQHLSPETHEHHVVEADMESKVNAQSRLRLKQLGDENNALTRTWSPRVPNVLSEEEGRPNFLNYLTWFISCLMLEFWAWK